jgi:hypothetical protein
VKPTARATIESSLRECASHRKWVNHAREKLAARFPLSPASLEHLGEHEVELLDQMIYRFTKLQDSMARRLLPSLYELLEGPSGPTPFLDILNRLEALRVVPSVRQWQLFRNLRNNLAHDYPESTGQTAATLNQLYEDFPLMEAFLDSAANQYHSRME